MTPRALLDELRRRNCHVTAGDDGLLHIRPGDKVVDLLPALRRAKRQILGLLAACPPTDTIAPPGSLTYEVACMYGRLALAGLPAVDDSRVSDPAGWQRVVGAGHHLDETARRHFDGLAARSAVTEAIAALELSWHALGRVPR